MPEIKAKVRAAHIPVGIKVSTKGERGDQGKSAYQSALDGGFVGSEAEFNLWLGKLWKVVLHDYSSTGEAMQSVTVETDGNDNVVLRGWMFRLDGSNTEYYQDVTLPMATAVAAGLMSGDDYTDLQELKTDVAGLKASGKYVGSFASYADLPTDDSDETFTSRPDINDFVHIQADETKNGVKTQYIASVVTPDGTITWSYDGVINNNAVQSVNNKTGAVVLGAEDITASVITEANDIVTANGTVTALLSSLSGRIKALLDRFSITGGHKHNGADSRKISYSDLDGAPPPFSEDAVGNLQNQIDEINANIDTVQDTANTAQTAANSANTNANGRAPNSAALNDNAESSTLPATGSNTVWNRIQVLRDNVKSAFARLDTLEGRFSSGALKKANGGTGMTLGLSNLITAAGKINPKFIQSGAYTATTAYNIPANGYVAGPSITFPTAFNAVPYVTATAVPDGGGLFVTISVSATSSGFTSYLVNQSATAKSSRFPFYWTAIDPTFTLAGGV